MGFTMEEINNMPIRDRRIYIKKHNMEQMKKKYGKYNSQAITNRNSINNIAKNMQKKIKNGTENID